MCDFCNSGLLTVIFFKNDCDMQDMSAPVSTKAFVDIPLIESFVVCLCSIEVIFISAPLCPSLRNPGTGPSSYL